MVREGAFPVVYGRGANVMHEDEWITALHGVKVQGRTSILENGEYDESE